MAWYKTRGGHARHRAGEAADRQSGDGRHRRRRNPRSRVGEHVRDATRQQPRPDLGRQTRTRSRRGSSATMTTSRPRTTSRGPISTATAKPSCSTHRSSDQRASRRPTTRTRRRSSGLTRRTGSGTPSRRTSRHHPPCPARQVGRQQARAVPRRELRGHRALSQHRIGRCDEVRKDAALARPRRSPRRASAPAT